MEKGSAKVSAKARVKSVRNFVKLSEEKNDKVLSGNAEKLALSEKQCQRWHKKYKCLTEFDSVTPIDPPL